MSMRIAVRSTSRNRRKCCSTSQVSWVRFPPPTAGLSLFYILPQKSKFSLLQCKARVLRLGCTTCFNQNLINALEDPSYKSGVHACSRHFSTSKAYREIKNHNAVLLITTLAPWTKPSHKLLYQISAY